MCVCVWERLCCVSCTHGERKQKSIILRASCIFDDSFRPGLSLLLFFPKGFTERCLASAWHQLLLFFCPVDGAFLGQFPEFIVCIIVVLWLEYLLSWTFKERKKPAERQAQSWATFCQNDVHDTTRLPKRMIIIIYKDLPSFLPICLQPGRAEDLYLHNK